jgi:hypothetical protein
VNESQPVLRFFTPACGNTSAFCQPTEGSFDNPTSDMKALFTWDWTVIFRLIFPVTMFDVQLPMVRRSHRPKDELCCPIPADLALPGIEFDHLFEEQLNKP